MSRFQDKPGKYAEDQIFSSRTYFTDNEIPTVTDRTYSRSITPNPPLRLNTYKYINSLSNKLLKALDPSYSESLFNFAGSQGVECLFNHDGYAALDKREAEEKRLRKQFKKLRKKFGRGIVKELYDKRVQWDTTFKEIYDQILMKIQTDQEDSTIEIDEDEPSGDESLFETRIVRYADKVRRDTSPDEVITETRIRQFQDTPKKRHEDYLKDYGRKSEIIPSLPGITLLGLPPLPSRKKNNRNLSESVDQGNFTLRGEQFFIKDIDIYSETSFEGTAEVPPSLPVKHNSIKKTKRAAKNIKIVDWKSLVEKDASIRGGKFREGIACGIANLLENEIQHDLPRLELKLNDYETELELHLDYEVEVDWGPGSRPISPDFRRLGFFDF
jgi:hypothetical protein